MFIWSGQEITLKLKELQDIKKITIATAFLSEFGIDLLKEVVENNRIAPEDVTVYLSIEFSSLNSAELLEKLILISKPYIVVSTKLHAKVLLFEGKNRLLFSGSSNLTKGGFQNNLEFNYISDAPDVARVHDFFEKCGGQAVPVDSTVIEVYRKTESKRQRARKEQNALHDMLSSALTFDAFNESDYPNLSQQYFQFRDYETLFEKNKRRKDPDIARRRQMIQQKLLSINALVKQPMSRLGLVHHWRQENITSTIIPLEYNRFQVEWCGVRYTRSETARYIKELKLSGDGYGFPKYACLQFCLVPRGFEINLFHAVRHDAVDRDYFRKAILNKKFRQEVEGDINNLKGYDLWWYAGDSSFSIDNESPDEFIPWYKENDRDGSETYLAYYFEPNSLVLESKQTIADVFVEYAEILLPLFDKMSFGWKNT